MAEDAFSAAVLDQIRRLEAALDDLLEGDRGAVERIRRLACTVRGSGASCGFPTVSALAARVEEAAPGDLVPTVRALLVEMERMRATRHSVLVVDDDPLILRLLELRLTGPDRTVVTAATLAEARAALRARRPDLVVLDLFLPDGDGRTLLAELRASEDTWHVPVVVVSGASARTARLEVEAMGADVYLSKPFDPNALSAVVASLLERRPEARQGRAELMASFRRLLSEASSVTVAAVVPETHGPGGKRSEGPDPRVASAVVGVLTAALPDEVTVAEWAPGEPAVVAPGFFDLVPAMTRARYALRNRPHPYLEGGLCSFSAGVLEDAQRWGLSDAYLRAHRFALDANREGGDRVVVCHSEGGRLRVLLAMKDAGRAALFIARLEGAGFEVEHHRDGASALDALETSQYSLAIVEADLPVIDGLDVVTKAKGLESCPPVMLVAASEAQAWEGLDRGADDYLLRDCSADELLARARRHV
ncbi:MAG: hypothetical protein KatS3mg011_1010 [Acidimicrobiia bacterium]|nr:MAG: hypothetical protein KatS3mg011_1010 [Acidimicrobiia bacterium]